MSIVDKDLRLNKISYSNTPTLYSKGIKNEIKKLEPFKRERKGIKGFAFTFP